MDIFSSTTSPTLAELRAQYGEPHELTLALIRDHFDESQKAFIKKSPFVLLGTVDRSGFPTVSPKGDSPGFVTILDDRTLLLPDRPGNKKLTTLTNIVEHPKLGLMFLVPGHREVLRAQGTAVVSRDPALLEMGSANGRLPLSTLVFRLHRSWIHCGKAVIRSRLWQDDYTVGPGEVPSLGTALSAEKLSRARAADLDEFVETNYQEELY